MPMNILRSKSAYSILELALVLPLSLGLLGAAFDTFQVLNARSALETALQAALRICYPADGPCLQSQNAPPSAQYNWYASSRWAQSSATQVRFSGLEKYFMLPQFELKNFRATILSEVLGDLPAYRYRASWPGVRGAAQGVRFLWRRALFPYISGNNPRSPLFALPYNHTRPYPQIPEASSARLDWQNATVLRRLRPLLLTQSESSYQTGPWVSAGSFTVHAPRLTPKLSCFVREPLPNQQLTSISCSHNWPVTSLWKEAPQSFYSDTGYIVLHALGSAATSGIDACGKVELRLEPQRADTKARDLGGQDFRGPLANASFYPRGIPLTDCRTSNQPGGDSTCYIDPGADWRERPEFSDHQAIQVQYETPYRLMFRLTRLKSFRDEQGQTRSCSTAPLAWRFSELHLYSQLYEEQSRPAVICANSWPDSVAPEHYRCIQNEYLAGALYGLPEPRWQVPPGQTDLPGSYTSEASARLDLPAELRDRQPPVQLAVASPSGFQTVSAACPANFGIASPHSAPDGFIRDQTVADAACPRQLLGLLPGQQTVLQDVRWRQAEVSVPHAAISWSESTCQESPPENQAQAGYTKLPQGLRRYANLRWDTSLTGYLEQATGPATATESGSHPLDPDWLQLHDPRYSCAGILSASRRYDQALTEKQQVQGSIFSGEWPNRDACDWPEELRREATLRFGMSPLAFFIAQRDPLAGPAPVCPATKPQAASVPSPCTVLSFHDCQSQPEMVPNGPYGEGQVPARCTAPEVSCQRRSIPSPAQPPATPSFSAEAAIAEGYRTIKALVPWSRPDCQGRSCARIDLSFDPQNSRFYADGSLAVPLPFLSLLSPRFQSLTIQHKSRERWEGYYATNQ